MNKLILLILLVMAGVKGASAQEALAVLKSGDTTKTYAGFSALQKAYTDAKDGDLITLSSGTFGAVAEIEKSITIRGAGAYIDNTYKTQPTYISGNFSVSKKSVTIEGIAVAEGHVVTLKSDSPKFIKCKLQSINYYTYEKDGKSYYINVDNAYFLHCQVLKQVYCTGSMTFLNCQVYHPNTYNKTSCSMTFKNCVVEYPQKVYSSTFINCYVHFENTNGSWSASEFTTFTNCLFYPKLVSRYGGDASPSYNNCWNNDNYDNIFVKDSWYVFTDSSKGKYLDEYGREIGIHGGTFPWKNRVAGPHIKSMEVAPRSSADGKLRIKMRVENSSY